MRKRVFKIFVVFLFIVMMSLVGSRVFAEENSYLKDDVEEKYTPTTEPPKDTNYYGNIWNGGGSDAWEKWYFEIFLGKDEDKEKYYGTEPGNRYVIHQWIDDYSLFGRTGRHICNGNMSPYGSCQDGMMSYFFANAHSIEKSESYNFKERVKFKENSLSAILFNFYDDNSIPGRMNSEAKNIRNDNNNEHGPYGSDTIVQYYLLKHYTGNASKQNETMGTIIHKAKNGNSGSYKEITNIETMDNLYDQAIKRCTERKTYNDACILTEKEKFIYTAGSTVSPGQTFELTVNRKDTNIVPENCDQISRVDNAQGTTYTIKVAENPTATSIKVTIYYKWNIYKAHYDIYESGGNIAIDPSEMVLDPTDSEFFTIPIVSNVSVNQYIHSVNEKKVQYVKKEENEWKLKTTSERGKRGTWNEDNKKNKPAILENGDTVVYKVKVKNDGKKTAYVQLTDKLPPGVKIERIERSNKPTNTERAGKNTINQSSWPGVNDNNNLKIGTGKTITFTITAKVSTTGEQAVTTVNVKKNGKTEQQKKTYKYYDYNKPCEAVATITAVRFADKKTGGTVFKAAKDKSRDYFSLKKYNVSVNTYISAVKRADGSNLQNNEYIVEDNNYSIGRNRKGKADDQRQKNPVFVENGDTVTYKIIVKNGAKKADPYFSPEAVDINLTNTLPSSKSEIKSVSAKKGDGSSYNLSYNVDNRNINFNQIPLANGKNMTITLTIKINNNANTVLKYDTLYKNTAKITQITNHKDKTVTGNQIINVGSPTSSKDYFKVKDYNVAIDKYITNVEHQYSRDGDLATYQSDNERKSAINVQDGKGNKDGTKQSSPVSVEYGDKVTYQMKVYNTTAQGEYNIGNRQEGPYRDPQYITVDIKDTLPEKCTILSASINGNTVINDPSNDQPNDEDERDEQEEGELPSEDGDNDLGGQDQDEDENESEEDGEIDSEEEEDISQSGSVNQSGSINGSGSEDNLYDYWGAIEDLEEEDVNEDQSESDSESENSGDTNENFTEEKDDDFTYEDYNKYSAEKKAELESCLKGVKVPKNGVVTITITLMVEEADRAVTEINTAELKNITNINGYKINNHSKRTSSSDWYQLNDYNASIDQRISIYNAEMKNYNEQYQFIEKGIERTAFNHSFDRSAEQWTNENPLELEKYETLTVVTKVSNDAKDSELEGNTGSYKKYNTRVRPSTVTIKGKGFYRTGTRAEWHKANGEVENIAVNVSNKEQKNLDNSYDITDNNIILSPGEYILYFTDVTVMESNLCLQNVEISSEITKLTNINRGNDNKTKDNEREVTKQNIAKQKQDVDYMKLKDLVIAGSIWIDENRDGKQEGEAGQKPDYIQVKLYRVDHAGKVERIQTVSTKTNEATKQAGFYTFGRQAKADKNGNYYQYYVEFEYDGTIYKATEVYGGDNDGEADGMQNLGGREGSKTWRQGYNNLPNTKSGNVDYITDSNAYEFDNVRNEFNAGYETIGFNKSYIEQTYSSNPHSNNPHSGQGGTEIVSVNTLNYDKMGHKSTLKTDANRVMRARSFITQSYNGTINENRDNTNLLYLYDYEKFSNEYPETEYLKFINLGLVEREEVDLSLDADVYSAKTTINGEEMTYDYNEKRNSQPLTADSTNYDKENIIVDGEGKKYNHDSDYKLNEAYDLDLYSSDYYYRHNDYYNTETAVKDYKKETSELNAEVTYRIRVTNNQINDDEPEVKSGADIPVETAINELAIYYDKNFKKADSTTKVLTSIKDTETGLLKEKEERATRVHYGTEEELNNGEGRELTINTSSQYGNKEPTDLATKEYNVMYLTGMKDIYIPEGESKYIEITLTIDKETREGIERCLKITEDEDMGLELISEISAYTTKYAEDYYHNGLKGQYAGLVDRDSNPGNLGMGGKSEDYPNYEDDTYKVGVKIGLLNEPDGPTPPPDNPNPPNSPERSISGKVWDDARNEKIDHEDSIQYSGNGEYNSSDTNDQDAKTNPKITYNEDKPVADIKVSLIEVIQTEAVDADGNAIYYEYPARYTYDIDGHKKGEKIETRTNENGEYTLNHFIPGYYKVRFDYGDDKELETSVIYNGQDYKSTTYYNEDYYQGKYQGDDIGKKLNFQYFDDVKDTLNKSNFSDAQDDEIRRLNVNSYSETMTALQAVVFSEKENNKERLTNNTHMFAESTIFYVKPEEVESAETHIKPSEYVNFNEERLWNIKSLDFGIEYRPEASIILDKQIATVELVTSDGGTLMKLYFKDENGERILDENKSKGYENVQYLPNQEKEQQGFVYVNMDTDILEGCTIKVEYEMTAENNSEVDRVNQNLDTIKYEVGANDYGTDYKVYARNNVGTIDGDEKNIEYTYNANATASQLLGSKYYENYNFNNGTETYNYLKQLKKSYEASGETNISNVTLEGQEYYGMYLGEAYYTGKAGENDIVAELKVDHILDYIDNDFTFSQSENNTQNRLWTTTTSGELYQNNMLNWNKVNWIEQEENGITKKYLIDKFGVKYDTKNKSNLALSVDDNKSGTLTNDKTRTGNVSLSKFLKTNKQKHDKEECAGTISAIATKVISADDISNGKGLAYENISEIIQYTSLTGRRTTLPNGNGGGVIGNANTQTSWKGYEKYEDDTDATEVITISPPTGLTE